MDGGAISLKLSLDEESLEILQNLAGAQRATVEEYVASLVRKAIKGEQRAKKGKERDARAFDAPMDAFLPDGADPFSPHGTDPSSSSGLASSFAEVQTRMRFAGTPSIFRDQDHS